MKKFLVNIIALFIPFKKLRRKFRGAMSAAHPIERQFQPIPDIPQIDFFQNNFEHYISVALMIRDEAKFLPEWLEFHILMGVTKFYIYDNESTDNIKEVLKPYIKAGLVEYTFWPSKPWTDVKDCNQYRAYRDALSKCRDKTKWLMAIDSDEFMQPLVAKNLKEFLAPFDAAGISQIGVNWHVFGTGGHLCTPAGILCENYRFMKKSSENKSIINPRSVIEMNCHCHHTSGATVDENMTLVASESKCNGHRRNCYTNSSDKIRCAHYQSKSLEDWMNKLKRGYNVRKHNPQLFFDIDDDATIYDDRMAAFAPKIKAAIKKRYKK